MHLHLYCIVPDAHSVPEHCIGVDSQRPFMLDAGAGLAIWATGHEEPVPASVDAVRVHNDVVTAAMGRSVTPVPLRFGQSAPDRSAAAELVTAEAARWLDLLERFRGRAEYGVRVMRDVSETEQDVRAASVQSGTEYMAALAWKRARAAERRSEGERIVAETGARLGLLAIDTRVEYPPTGRVVATIAHLVAWTDADAYHDAARALRVALQNARLVVTGPWPPYSFVE
ncbi:MAG TPA: GvpL/GvpF family gas vesicle protein [Longimicrobiales bacterium]|nr:GvpL/GvpF family gas vesicle protein [Longimicrobiales bacterium]